MLGIIGFLFSLQFVGISCYCAFFLCSNMMTRYEALVGHLIFGSLILYGTTKPRSLRTHIVDASGASMQGLRDYMEDEFVIHETDLFSFFGIFDGHGGTRASFTAKTHMTKIFESYPFCLQEPVTAVKQTYQKTEEKYLELYPRNNGFEGTTAVVVILAKNRNRVIVANTGDSRCIVFGKGQVRFQTIDHKPSLPSEYDRINNLGGRVGYELDDSPRVFGRNGLGGLALSRAIGDTFYGEMVPVDPDVTEFNLNSEDEYIVLASDGVWDVMTSFDVCDLISMLMEKGVGAQKACDILVQRALVLGSSDNVTAIVVDVREQSKLNK